MHHKHLHTEEEEELDFEDECATTLHTSVWTHAAIPTGQTTATRCRFPTTTRRRTLAVAL